ncbi:MAG: hypothetical protein GWO20_00075 [Candidatus Korarchaeota archaeon]|nr:hypothetical protein [Candidatus Korarchaeota archaeon]NIU81890.1 hypothetical protein [Candidatus Thorarchaeota archaeon]
MEGRDFSFIVVDEGGTQLYSFPRRKVEKVAFSSLVSAISAIGSEIFGEGGERKKLEVDEKTLLLLEEASLIFVLVVSNKGEEDERWELLETLRENFIEKFGTNIGWLSTHITELHQFDGILQEEVEHITIKWEVQKRKEKEEQPVSFRVGQEIIKRSLSRHFETDVSTSILEEEIEKMFEDVKIFINWDYGTENFEAIVATEGDFAPLGLAYKKLFIYLYGERTNGTLKNLKIEMTFHKPEAKGSLQNSMQKFEKLFVNRIDAAEEKS